MSEFKIPTCNVGRMMADLAKLNLRIAKKGLDTPPVTVTFLRTSEVELENSMGFKTGAVMTFEHFEVEGVAPKFNGWKLIAKLTDASFLYEGATGTVVSMVPGEPELPVSWRTAEITCEHCGTNRRRRDTFLVQNETTGQVMQVGRQCLADFLGHKSPEAIASLCEWIIAFFAGAEDEYGHSGQRQPDFYRTREYLAWVSMSIRKKGWISRKMAQDNGYSTPTSSDALSMMENASKKAGVTPDAEDYDRADVALGWVESHLCSVDPDTLNDYMFKLRLTCESERVAIKSLGICASLIPTVEREMGLMKERESKPVSQHVGTVKERREFVLNLIRVRELEGNFGVTHMHTFLDADGNRFVWFASNAQRGLVNSEDPIPVVLVGTIKAHDEYKGTKQTILTRCKVKEVG